MRELELFLGSDYSLEQLTEKMRAGRDLADRENWGTYSAAVAHAASRPRRLVPRTGEIIVYPEAMEKQLAREAHVYESGVTARLTIRSMEKVAAGLGPKAVAARDPGVPDPSFVAWGIAQVIVWPFFLSLALALRLAKATADISGWPKPG
jgi:hypothetical protein